MNYHDLITLGVAPSVAGFAFDNQVFFLVVVFTHQTHCQGVTRSAERVVIEPRGVDPRIIFATSGAHGTPLALPTPLRHCVQRWIDAVDVIAYVTFVTEQEVGLVTSGTATLAHSTVKAPPALL